MEQHFHKQTNTETATPHWGYVGKEGPHNWGKLNKEFASCSLGHSQSPINITTALMRRSMEEDIFLKFDYQPALFSIINNGHTIQLFSEDKRNTLILANTVYTLVQFHFHTPSEHQINGIYSKMEIHLVHTSENGKIAVVALLVEEGKENSTLRYPWDHFPKSVIEEPIPLKHEITISDLLPKNLLTYQYIGSLTTPPCTEDVHWIILTNHITLSAQQIHRFQQLFPHNNRPIQPVHNREIIIDEGMK